MSTGYECEFFEYKPNEWYYTLQNWDCPVGAFDWREYATTYGAFQTLDLAQRHLDRYHANPGGCSILPYTPERSAQRKDVVKDARLE